MALPDGFDPERALLSGLPPCEGGRMSDTLYNAGYGLHYLDGQGMELTRGFRGSPFVMLQRMQRFTMSGYEVTSMPDKPSVTMTDGRLRIDVEPGYVYLLKASWDGSGAEYGSLTLDTGR